jgi:pimeloyl-ACP methyl ester carboxylesterase
LLPDVAIRTRDALPRATLAQIPDCSHFPFLEAPETLIALLARFLGDNGETERPESDV